jgi:hypothetical protein
VKTKIFSTEASQEVNTYMRDLRKIIKQNTESELLSKDHLSQSRKSPQSLQNTNN